ncbi:hypothetical protein HYT33_00025 [Candidatus Roizmanbacteria bacterium]|nr:hypothetical protein [Candidatus Roizmanbacteria bacterium]
MKKLFSYFFVPGEKNGFRAKALQHDFLTYYLLFALIVVFTTRTFGTRFENVLGFATDITVEKLVEYTNSQRQKNGLPPLSLNEKLSQAARKKAEDMFVKNYWAHYTPDGQAPWDFILSSDYDYEYAGENLAKNFLFSSNVVDAWIASETHRQNILRSEYTDVGFAVVNGVLNGEETTLVVQMFGKPQNFILSQKEPAIAQSKKPVPPRSQISKKRGVVLANTSALKTNFIYLFLLFLTILVVLDLYVATKMNLIRIHGKSFAHFIFLTAIFFGLFLFLSKGIIL